MQMRDKMGYALLLSINLQPHVSFLGIGEEVLPEGKKNKSIASSKVAQCYLKCEICPDIRIMQQIRSDL